MYMIIHKNRVNKIRVNMNEDVSQMDLTSEIRTQPDVRAPLIAEWDVDFETDGTDGFIILTMSDVISGQIEAEVGYMDIKKVVNNEPYAVFDRPLEVRIQGTVTA
jgi:hypothetical protein